MENLTNEALEAPRDFENFSALNCIDLSSPDILNSVSLLKQACLDSGFFYVINHGISQEFMDEVFYQSKSFFDLPVSEKMKVLRNKKHRGYTPLFNQSLDPGNQIHGDYKEGFVIGIEVPENDPDIEKPLYGPNVWPPSDVLPGWRETMEKYHREALSTLHRVLGNGQERYSIAYFVEPNHDCLVECLPTCQSQENPPKFPPIKCETYMLQRYKDTHAALESYAK
ncbi:hypothetical protein TEA_027814 [Camellia sinensis var. sinensis]|uniref:Non-haem dioxygenase N-terminal domain-containing protein n=1 Tax=Camellia sinensis var. sinensis TaxID=542762 RepID=A0A4V3WLI2_CAMSN|nr:hypothetical protein TEA_027814 [Camellia sinensis var. sinensis]